MPLDMILSSTALIPSLDFPSLREKNVFKLRKYLPKIMKDKVLLEASIFCLPPECNNLRV